MEEAMGSEERRIIIVEEEGVYRLICSEQWETYLFKDPLETRGRNSHLSHDGSM